MAEFCEECYEELFGKGDYLLTDDYDLCEGCGEMKRVVVGERRYCGKMRYVRRALSIVLFIPRTLWAVIRIPYVIYKMAEWRKQNKH